MLGILLFVKTVAVFVRHEVEDLDQLHDCSASIEDPIEKVDCRDAVEEAKSRPVTPVRNLGSLKDHDQDLDCSKENEHDREAEDWAQLDAADAMVSARLV